MRSAKGLLWPMGCAMAISSCSSVGKVARPPECPILAPVSPSLMLEPTTEATVRGELFAPPPSVTPKSAASRLK